MGVDERRRRQGRASVSVVLVVVVAATKERMAEEKSDVFADVNDRSAAVAVSQRRPLRDHRRPSPRSRQDRREGGAAKCWTATDADRELQLLYVGVGRGAEALNKERKDKEKRERRILAFSADSK